MRIRFTAHAQQKFEVLRQHNVNVSRKLVIQTLENPKVIDHSRLPLLIAQGELDEKRVLRIVYRTEGEVIVVITFYPGRKSQYETQS